MEEVSYGVLKNVPVLKHSVNWKSSLRLLNLKIYLTKVEKRVDGSNLPEVFCKKGVLRNFAKFTGKRLYQSLFFKKVAGFRPITLLKKRLGHRCFPVNLMKFLRTPFFIEHLVAAS